MPFDSPLTGPVGRTFLPRRGTLMLENAAGTVIAVDRGCLWITQERDPRDIVLVKGMRFEVDRGGRTVIAAEEDSRLRLLGTPPLAERIATRLRGAISRAVKDWSSRLYRRSVPYF